MKRIRGIIIISVMFLLCACGNNVANYKYQQTDVSKKNEQAQVLYDSGQFKESLAVFSLAMQEEPKDITARIGMVKCQIAMENYSMALMDLNLAVEVMPQEEILYDLFLDISVLMDDISVAQDAVELAECYDITEFLEKVPEKPVFTYENGNYDRRIEISFSSEKSDETEIYFSVYKEGGYWYPDLKYEQPWTVTSGETKVSAYCVRDGIPSEMVEVTYICEYEPSAVQFQDTVMGKLVSDILGKPEEEITDIDCEGITNLDIYYLQTDGMSYEESEKLKIQTLEDLEYFPNLTLLRLGSRSEVKDYSAVKQCPLINYVSITDSELSDISFLSDLPNLYDLKLSNNQITDIGPILQCKQLEYLDLRNNPITDISELAELKRLTTLDFSVGQLTDISVLKQLDDLKYLYVYCRGDDNLSEIGQLTRLERLGIYYEYWDEDYDERNYIKDISYLENLTNLTSLYISGLEDLTYIEPIKKLINLQDLSLYNRNKYDTEMDEKAIKELQQELPQCNVNY